MNQLEIKEKDTETVVYKDKNFEEVLYKGKQPINVFIGKKTSVESICEQILKNKCENIRLQKIGFESLNLDFGVDFCAQIKYIYVFVRYNINSKVIDLDLLFEKLWSVVHLCNSYPRFPTQDVCYERVARLIAITLALGGRPVDRRDVSIRDDYVRDLSCFYEDRHENYLEILHLTGFRFDHVDSTTQYYCSQKTVQTLNRLPSLQNLSATIIRRELKENIAFKVGQLPLPKLMCERLLFGLNFKTIVNFPMDSKMIIF